MKFDTDPTFGSIRKNLKRQMRIMSDLLSAPEWQPHRIRLRMALGQLQRACLALDRGEVEIFNACLDRADGHLAAIGRPQ